LYVYINQAAHVSLLNNENDNDDENDDALFLLGSEEGMETRGTKSLPGVCSEISRLTATQRPPVMLQLAAASAVPISG